MSLISVALLGVVAWVQTARDRGRSGFTTGLTSRALPFELPNASTYRTAIQTADRSASDLPHESTTCLKCHAEIVAEYQRNGMSRTFQLATQSNTADVARAKLVIDTVSNYQYLVVGESDGLAVIETHPDEPTHRLRQRAAYLVGSGKRAQSLVAADGDSLTQLPVAWFREIDGWRPSPGFELKNHRFDRPVVAGCVNCHATQAIQKSPAPNRFAQPIAHGIECRRCHGPSRRHVEFWQTQSDQPLDDVKLAHPGQLSPEQANDLCLQCHLQGDVTWHRQTADPGSFRPGDRLRDCREDFLLATDEATALGIASHGARMLQSRCYSASGGKLTCVLCHDTHRPIGDFTPAHYDRKCATCHQPESCARKLDDGDNQLTSGCVACHMPQRSTRESIHMVLTDHAMPRHKLDFNAPRGPITKLPANQPARLISCWPSAPPSPTFEGIAYVLLHETMGPHEPSLRLGRTRLETALRADLDNHDLRFWLGTALLGLREASNAIRQFHEVLNVDPDRHVARFRLALAYELAGDIPAAIASYERLLRDAPEWLEPPPRLAQLYLARGEADLAASVLLRQLTLRRDAATLAQLGLAHRLRGGTHAESLNYLQDSLQLDPRSPHAFLNRGALHLLAGDHGRARADFQRVLDFEPGHPQARQAIEALPEAHTR